MGVPKQLGFVLLTCVAGAIQAGAQHSSFQFYGPDLGLTNQNVIALHQDHNGFLWVGTEGGLFRYDGDRFRLFPIETQRKKGIVAVLHSSSDGQLWAGTSAGLFRWRGDRFAIEPSFEDMGFESAQALASDADTLYVATQSGVRTLPLRGTARARIFSSKRSYSVMVASDHTVWYGCDSSLCSMAGGRMIEWGSERGVTNGPWRYIAEDVSGRIWIRSMTRVLVKEPGATAFHEMIKLRGLDSTRGWQVITTRSGRALIPHNSGLTVCSGGECWKHGQESGLRHTEILAAVVDREGSLWLGYSGHGLARWLGRNQWESFTEQEGLGDLGIWRIVRGRAGDVWLGTTHGLFHGSQVAGQWRFRRAAEVGDLTIYGLESEPDGSLWIGAYQTKVNGLIRFNPKTHATQVYAPPPGWPPISVKAVFRDETGTVWVGTSTGVLRLRPGTDELEHYPTPLDGATVFDVRSTPQGLFAGGKKGLYIEKGQMRRLLTTADGLRDNVIQSVFPRPDGSVWLDYFAPDGISRLDIAGNSLQMQHFSTGDGLPSDIVYGQFFDAWGRHWVTTDNGAAVLEGYHWVHSDT